MNENELYNVVIMIMKRIRPDGQFSYFSYSEVQYIDNLLHKIKAGSEGKMSKCRYDLSEDCDNTDCHNCMLNKIKADIYAKSSVIYVPTDWDPQPRKDKIVRLDDVYEIIEKYRKEDKK